MQTDVTAGYPLCVIRRVLPYKSQSDQFYVVVKELGLAVAELLFNLVLNGKALHSVYKEVKRFCLALEYRLSVLLIC